MTKRLLIFVGLAIALFSAAAQAAAVKATLAGVKGTVFVQPAGGSFAPVKDGAKVSEGASIKTGPDGEAVVKWGAGNTVKLTALTLAKIDALTSDDKGASKSNFSLSQGRVISRVGKLGKESSFTVKTPAAIAGVRGTAFDCGIDPISNQTQIAVVEGSVSVEAGGVEVVLEQGFESAITPGEAPETPVEISQEKMDDLKATVEELKDVSEIVPDEGGDEGGDETEGDTGDATDEVVDDVIETVEDNTVETNTTEADIIDDVTEGGCPAGGGCIQGIIDMESEY